MGAYKDADELSPAERWVIALTVMFGAFMAVMDTSVVNVSMPHMMGSFGQDLSSITWVATAYSIAEIIMATMAGWWSALIGRKTLYMGSFALFTLGSVLCGTAVTFPQMLVYRVIQGIGGGALIPVSQAILRETFPQRQQGMAMAVYGMGVVLAPALGPVFGGWLTDRWGWPWIFYINVPVCALGMFLTARYVFDPDYLKRGLKKVDWPGIVLLSVAMTGMQVVLERGQENNWFESTGIVLGTALTVASLVGLIFWELRASEPVVNLRLLKNRGLSLGSGIGLIFGVSLFGTTFILPQFMQNLLGYPAFDAALVLMPRALVIMALMPLAGWLYRHSGARAMVMTGIVFITWAYYDLTLLNLDAGFWDFVPALLIMGAGMPFMFVPLSTVALSTVDRSEMTDASSLYTLSRRIGGNIGYALVATLLSQGRQSHRATLAGHLTDLSPGTREYLDSMAATLQHLGIDAYNASNMALAKLEALLERQAALLAYNDISLYFGYIFISMIPLVILLPGMKAMREEKRRERLEDEVKAREAAGGAGEEAHQGA